MSPIQLNSRLTLRRFSLRLFLTLPSEERGGLKEIGQNPDSGSNSSENQNDDD